MAISSFNTHRGLLVLLAVATVLCRSTAMARSPGAPAFRNGSIASGAINCSGCHANSMGFTTGSVEILGAPMQYNSNRLYSISVRVADPVQLGAGFELSAEGATGAAMGVLLLADSTLTRFADNNPAFVTHTSLGVLNTVSNWAANGNSATFNLRWRAPAANAGTVTFFAAGLAINNAGSSGDRLYLTNRVATPAACTKGDANGDDSVNGADINAFVATLIAPDAASAPAFCAADFNNDGSVDAADVVPFIAGLLGS